VTQDLKAVAAEGHGRESYVFAGNQPMGNRALRSAAYLRFRTVIPDQR
jgi:hypothetical protein